MSNALNPITTEDRKGVERLGIGAAMGVAAAVMTLVVPVLFVLLAAENPGGFFSFAPALIQTTAILVLAGAILFLLSLFLYRRAFAHFRKVDRRFLAASVLCIVGSVGFLLLLVAAAVVLGNASSLTNCLHGQPSHALSCLRSGQPLGAYTGLLGFWLAWLGGVGIVLGLAFGGARSRRRVLYAGSAVYAILLLLLVGPFIALVFPVPGITYLLWTAPFLALIAPALVLAASRMSAAPRPGTTSS
jgi:hypothetical protein